MSSDGAGAGFAAAHERLLDSVRPAERAASEPTLQAAAPVGDDLAYRTLRYSATARPSVSNPGPRLAIDAGTTI